MNQTPTLFDDTVAQSGKVQKDSQRKESTGYKYIRHVGWIPEHWRVRRVGDVLKSLDAGYSASGEDRPAEEGEVGVLKVSAVSYDIFQPSENKRVPPENQKDLKISPKEGDLVISRSNTPELVGACVYVEDNYPNLYLPDTLWRIRVREGAQVLPRYLAYALGTSAIRARIRAIATGTSGSMKKIAMRTFRRLKVPFPPVEGQRRIAGILSTWDRAIEQVDALIAAKRERLHGLRQRLVTGDERFPEFNEPWEARKLGDYFRYFTKRNGDGTELTVLSCSKIHGVIPQAEKFDRRIASEDTSNYKIVERGDLVYDPMLLWDASIGFVDCVDRGVVSPAYYTFKFDERRGSRDFFRHLLATHHIRYQYKAISQGTNRRRRKAPREAFLGIEVDVPSLPEQRKIASVLAGSEAEIRQLEAKRDALKRQKKGLMQRLLTGRVPTV